MVETEIGEAVGVTPGLTVVVAVWVKPKVYVSIP